MDVIRIGDRTTHGGEVTSASETMSYDGRAVARVGDSVSCPLHPGADNTITEGASDLFDEGVAVARNGHRTRCGSRLISSLG